MPKVRMSKKDSLVEFCRALPGAAEDVKWGKDLTSPRDSPRRSGGSWDSSPA